MPSTCPCGSNEWPEPQFDGRGIYLCLTCSKCHKQKMSKYRQDILDYYDQNDVDEPIEPDGDW